MARRLLAVPQLIQWTLLVLLLVDVVRQILVLDAALAANLIAAHLLAFLVWLGAYCVLRRILSGRALLLSVDGARLRARVV